jgi:choice-of-anchor B domain-containing protein
MTLRGHLGREALDESPVNSVSGCWGYTSPDGRRFALVGTSSGLSIVEVTDPGNPTLITMIAGGRSQWREVKTYGQYVYVTTEARTGLDIVDMRDPDRPRKVRTWNTTFDSAHTLWIDEARGLLFANGTASGMKVLDLTANPEDPVQAGSFGDVYVHDSYTRGTTLYASAIAAGFLALLDVADPARIRTISTFPTGGGTTHNSWLTRDGRYLFTTDERPDSPVEGWDLLDPARPRRVTQYIGRAGTIPHNVMIDGDRLLIAHYTEGVHLLDVTSPERPQVLGIYDTYDGPSTGFNGVWGAYIFPGSGLIVASDIGGGLFVVDYNGP